MRKLFVTLLVLVTITGNLWAQSPSVLGAWLLNNGGETHYLFFQDGFCFHTVKQGKTFVMSQGGNFEVTNGKLNMKVLYNSSDSTKVGEEMSLSFSLPDNQLVLQMEEGEVKFSKIDDGKAPLAGVWKITGRMDADGKVADIHQTGSRQTYKLLTGTKFQWVAIDPEKKQFSGTGGGSYSFKDGKYTENIEFFSRDNSRVGAALSFDGKLEDGKWHHSGLSSKGDKIYEIWGNAK
ncbi:MAG: membrane or secreted protein [Pedobacter sp.]|uniref:hypothetical protein n=1 Tax=Pedobacter sp. JCM 36344 TaxID=3374280 RepID=UPI0019A5FED1|nr:membrane or secreted protein [Pedobacter sp.]